MMKFASTSLLMSTLLLLFIGCTLQTAKNEDALGALSPVDGQEKMPIATEAGSEWLKEAYAAESISWLANEILMASSDYNFEEDLYRLNIDKISASSSAPVRLYTIDFSHFSGILRGGRYNTHGTSAQRVGWFRRGFESGRLEEGDTFNAPTL